MKMNKKVAGLIMSGLMAISVVGCGKYEDKCNPEYYMIGQTIIGTTIYGDTLNERVENTILNTNKDENYKLELDINCEGETFKYNDKIYRMTIDEIIISKGNNDEGQFSDIQYGLLIGLNAELRKEYEEFKESESIKKYISNSLYEEVKEMYSDYVESTYYITEDYKGELSEDELLEIEWNNERYEEVMEDVAEEISVEFIQDILN